LGNANVGNHLVYFQAAIRIGIVALFFLNKDIIIKSVLTIAGSDSIGGAGIQADIKTITCNGCYAMSAITALTAQNTLGVHSVLEIPPLFLQQQLQAVISDITPDSVKIGMISNQNLINVTSQILLEYKLKNIVIDPVMISSSGTPLLSENAVSSLCNKLFPLATLITPNLNEAKALTGKDITNATEAETAAMSLAEQYNCAVLLKGGHSINKEDSCQSNDFLYFNNKGTWFTGKRINNPNNHGTGCTLSSAIASNLAKGFDLITSVQKAKEYINGCLNAKLNLGKGNGPMAHNWFIN